MNSRPYWFGVHWKNHNVKVTNARIPPEETWQVWYLQSWIWLGQRVSQCSLDPFPRRSFAVWPLSWPPDRVCSPGACSDCPLTCSCVHIGDICKVWNSERWGRHWKPMSWGFFLNYPILVTLILQNLLWNTNRWSCQHAIHWP